MFSHFVDFYLIVPEIIAPVFRGLETESWPKYKLNHNLQFVLQFHNTKSITMKPLTKILIK